MIRQHPIARSLAAALAMAGAAVAAAATQPVVAEATLVIGVAHVAGSDGLRRTVDRGSEVRVGDRIETEAGGHVHLRFVDGARVSVRPSSRLAIEDYTHSVAGGAGAIKFRLEEGVVRSITGEWGESSRERFRLNTPLAAIGIKGTDFVARAAQDKTTASVFLGSIVFSPLDAQCAASVGPCLNGREALLTQDMRGQVLQVERERAAQPMRVTSEAATPRGGRSLTTVVASAVVPTDTVDLAAVPKIEGAGKSIANAVLASDTLPTADTPAPPVVEQLAWGRWSWAQAIEGDVLAQTIDAAFREGRQGLVSDGAHALYRNAAAPGARLATKETSADFRLAGASAQVYSEQTPSPTPASVRGGTLGVDFVKSTFNTKLDVIGDTIGIHEVTAGGSVLSNGVMLSTHGNAFLAGGLSLDGLEAGYFFDKPIDGGNLRGITLWGR